MVGAAFPAGDGDPLDRGRGGAQRILHVEDDSHVRRAIAFAFGDLRCDPAPTVAAARALMTSGRHFAWVVDHHLPDGSGLDLLAWAREQDLTTPAIVVTADESAEIVRRAQLLGVELAYKPDLRANLRVFFERARLGRSIVPAVRLSVDRFAVRHQLSDRERELVRTTARGVARADLAAALGVSENTVKTLIRRILRKTSLHGVDDVLRAILAGGEPP